MNGVSFATVKPAHEDGRRSLTAIFNGDFTAKQVKVINVKKASTLGNHYHPYSELIYVLQGEASYTLEEVRTGERQSFRLVSGERLIIGPEIAHKVEMTEGTITIEATELPYHEPLVNDYKYEVK